MTTPSLSNLGIFWFVGASTDDLMAFAVPWAKMRPIGGFRTIEPGHADIWPELSRKRDHLKQVGYESYPRGRANYDEQRRMFLLLADRSLLGPDRLDHLVQL